MKLEFLFVPISDLSASLALYRDGLGFTEVDSTWAISLISLPGYTEQSTTTNAQRDGCTQARDCRYRTQHKGTALSTAQSIRRELAIMWAVSLTYHRPSDENTLISFGEALLTRPWPAFLVAASP